VARPRLVRGVQSLEAPLLFLPAEVVLDSSFVVESLVGTQPRHAVCREFLQRLLDNGTTLYFNRLLEVELAETAFRLALEERFPNRRIRDQMRRDGRARRRAGRLMEQARSAWDDVLAAFAYVCIELHEVARSAPGLMQVYGLTSYDAVHVATALRVGVRDLVTLDVGFANVPNGVLTIYTTAHRVPACRERRGAT
jgi:predicted nucleic acid-binding protein